MSRRSFVVWLVLTGLVLLTIPALLLLLLQMGHIDEEFGDGAFTLLFVAVFVIWGALGSLLVRKTSGNSVGWVLLCLGASAGITFTAEVLSIGIGPGADRWRVTFAWLESWFGDTLPPFLITFLFLVFPAGRLRTRLERATAALAVAVYGTGAALIALTPGRLPGHRVLNPFGVDAARSLAAASRGILSDGPGLFIVFVLALSTMVIRFRRSRGDERQQMKWFMFAASAFVTTLLSAGILTAVGGESETGEVIGGFVFVALFASLPVAISIAVLKYRLYDIDVVINRTLVYGALTAVLAAVYVGLVFAFQSLLGPFTAESDLAVAGSTLAVAALFRPMRSRVQDFIDHRFYRRKFDAHQTVERFNAQLRDEVDLTALSSKLTEVITETMQPAHVSLWLRNPGSVA